MLIINKPYGVPVQGGTKVSFCIDDGLRYLGSKNTTGILIIAKSKATATSITKLFKENKIKKIYWTIVKGKPKKQKDSIKKSILKKKKHGFEKMEIVKDLEENAITTYKSIDSKRGMSLLEVYPKTGRTHQIRVHLLSEKLPILGDKKYFVEADLPEHFYQTLKFYNLNLI